MQPNTETNVIYKVLTADQWEAAEAQGVFQGAGIDIADGYIHFSTAAQVRETVARHFDGQLNLQLIGVDSQQLGDALKWEPSRGGDLFPHLYRSLELESVVSVDELPLGKNGRHLFPDDLPDE